jgi:hypothetical protein
MKTTKASIRSLTKNPSSFSDFDTLYDTLGSWKAIAIHTGKTIAQLRYAAKSVDFETGKGTENKNLNVIDIIAAAAKGVNFSDAIYNILGISPGTFYYYRSKIGTRTFDQAVNGLRNLAS